MAITSGKNILIIDDALDTQELLRLSLEPRGFLVHCCPNGAEALKYLESQDALPDVILVDLRMPVMDGFGFLKLKRATPRIKNIPTIVMSADGDGKSIRSRIKPGDGSKSPDILLKPLNIKSVLGAIEKNIHSAPAPASNDPSPQL